MLLGTPNVFSVDQRTTALLTSRLKKEGASDLDIQRAVSIVDSFDDMKCNSLALI